MTSTSKSEKIRDVAPRFRHVAVNTGATVAKAATVIGTGSAGLGLQVARQGYALARRNSERRSARRALLALSPGTKKAAGRSSRRRTFVVLGSVVAVAAGAAVLASRRRNTFVPPADAPPSLDDYADTPPAADVVR